MEIQKAKLYSLEMFEDDPPEFIKSIVKLFVENTPISIAAIKTAYAENEMEQLRHHSHKLKPHFAFFASTHIQQALQMIENIARNNDGIEDLPGLIEYVEKNSIPMLEQMKADFLD
jgi:HPt (histidine-containing phosphotransfer) domain-containing protein